MGNIGCTEEHGAHLASIARDICPFPNYNPNPLYLNLLTSNSSLHLKNHYTEVQSSLTEKQLDLFNQGLRTTFGREGRVTLGGVGVVALSLALFFDTLSKQVKGQYVPESGIVSDVFVKDPRGYYPPRVYTLSEYLRLVPYIANNPTRMIEETERYLNELTADKQTLEFKERKEHVVAINFRLVAYLQKHMRLHLFRIANATVTNEERHLFADSEDQNKLYYRFFSLLNPSDDQSKRRRRGFGIYMVHNATIYLNCNPEKASQRFLAEVQKSNVSREALSKCKSADFNPKTVLHSVAIHLWVQAIQQILDFSNADVLVAQREAFDLKSNALKEWAQ